MRASGRMSRKRSWFAIAILTLSLHGCKSNPSEADVESDLSSIGSSTDAPAFIKMMYSKYNAGYEIQDDSETPDDCASLWVPADPSVPYKGVAVFHHGYTACPQQFWEIAQTLKGKGYSTLSILMPGQGRAPAPLAYIERITGDKNILSPVAEQDFRHVEGRRYADYYSEFIPKVQNGDWKRYLDFVDDINRFVKKLPGEKVLGGLSVGGELATYAYVSSPDLYKRVLLVAPYYGMPGPDLIEKFTGTNLDSESTYKLQKKIVTLGSRNLDEVAKMEVSWGPDCYKWTRGKNGKGRAGICDFRYENLAAINSVGDYVLTLLKEREELVHIPKIQYVAVDWDVGSNTVLARKAIAFQQTRFGKEQVQACFYPHSVPHSLFSRKDLVLLPETPWLDGFYRQAVDFLVNERNFAHAKTESWEFLLDPATNKDLTTKQFGCAM